VPPASSGVETSTPTTADARSRPPLDLLVCNLATDADDPVLGFTTGWINALAGRCESVDVLTMTAGRVDVAPNARVFSLGKEKGYSKPHRAFRFYALLYRLLSEKRYGACFCHMTPLFAVMGAPLLKPRRIRVVVWYAHGAAPRILRMADGVADAVVTPTPESYPLRSRKAVVVGHGIDTSLFTPAGGGRTTPAPFTIVVAGRIAPVKRLEVVVEAVRRLAGDILVRVVGPTLGPDAAYASQLVQAVDAAGLRERIVFDGPIPYRAMPDVYRHADLLVSTSRTGSADKVVLEAMACEVPVVTTNQAFRSVFDERSMTLMADPDDAEGLAERMRSVRAMSEAERRELGGWLRRIVERDHSLDRLADRLVTTIF
jgi:glycosyltransferase involved in cell wall biosynthesis